MLEIRPVSPRTKSVLAMIKQLDTYQASLYPPSSNHLDSVEELSQPHVRFLGAFDGKELLGCGAIKLLDNDCGEIKRMYVSPEARGKGVGHEILQALEAIAGTAGISVLRLETGVHQPEALHLYESSGYLRIEPFGEYEFDPLSVFLEKRITPTRPS
jgi:putative acetyltransferase